ncbi:hypothetical protein CAPTEDRAFT_215194 [Capitella teleta]|uniref:G-protein coupled receptors family 1 profile domain-containing protein n=1 Tax=Capitella teleta TaxID=283909 RepID=R7TMC0_CAPTE|nr:hypothetical protein CAPTEDRAFT_215194 [Capitella teleta]|eukprot:ELT94993.1 hypothetical protein CAPTEDRAFT_215194 [Capitella teleta]
MESTAAVDSTSTQAAAPLNARPCVLYYFVFGTLVGGSTIIIGLVGNVVSLSILGRERKKSSTIQALCLLAVADTCLLLAYLPTIPLSGIWEITMGLYESMNLVVFASAYIYEAVRVCNQVSAFLTMILMWQRYVAVCLPHKAKQLCTVRIVNITSACTSVSACLFYLPNFFLYSIDISEDGAFQPVSHPLVQNAYFQMIYSVILTYLLSYIIPVVSLMYMSIAILSKLKLHSNQTHSTNFQHVRKDLTKSSIGIVVIFVLCQSFQPIRRVLMWVYDPYVRNVGCGRDLSYFSMVPHVTLMLNSSANFCIYILFARGFRRKFIAIFTRKNNVAPTYSSESTRPGPSTNNLFSSRGCERIMTLSGTDSTHCMPLSGTNTDRIEIADETRIKIRTFIFICLGLEEKICFILKNV